MDGNDVLFKLLRLDRHYIEHLLSVVAGRGRVRALRELQRAVHRAAFAYLVSSEVLICLLGAADDLSL